MTLQQTFYIKQRATRPILGYVLLDDVNLAGATVRFYMRNKETGASVLDGASGGVQPGTTKPTLTYTWQAADTANSGVFEAEFEVTYSDGGIEKFPYSGMILVKIADDADAP